MDGSLLTTFQGTWEAAGDLLTLFIKMFCLMQRELKCFLV